MSASASSLPDAPRVLGVAVPTPLRRLFDYLPGPETPTGGWRPGLRVQVALGRRSVVGIVIES